MGLELLVHSPQGGAVKLEDLVPERGVVHAREPIRPETRVEQGQDPVRHPGGDVDAVRDVADWYTRDCAVGPQRGPDAAGLLPTAARPRGDPPRQAGKPRRPIKNAVGGPPA